MAAPDKKGSSKTIKAISGAVMAVIACITSITQFIELWQGNQRRISLVILTISIGTLWALLWYIYRKNVPSPRIAGFTEHRPRYPQWIRKSALVLMVIIPLLPIAGLGYHVFYYSDDSEQGIKIIVANFEREDQEQDFFTARIIESLIDYTNGELIVEHIDEHLSVTKGGSDRAREIGESENADLFIWGYYINNIEVVAYIEVLYPLDNLESFQDRRKGIRQSYRLGELEHTIGIRYRLGEDISYMSLYVAGLINLVVDWPKYQSSYYLAETIAYLASEERLSKSLEYFSEAMEIYPAPIDSLADGLIFYYRGLVLDLLGRYEEAIADFNQAIRRDSLHNYAYNNRGISLKNLGRYEEAIADFNEAIRLDSNHVQAYLNRGNVWDDLEMYEEAILEYNRALHVDENYALAYHNRGISLKKLGRYEEAIADYDKAIQLNELYVRAFYNRGDAYRELGETDKADRDFKKARELEVELTK